MAVEFNHTDYTTAKQILVFPDHYVCVAQTFPKDDPVATDVNGRKIVLAGTMYPANDATCIGVVFNDQDVTDGDRTGAVLIHGFVKTAALPVAPADAARSALPMVQFMPAKPFPAAGG